MAKGKGSGKGSKGGKGGKGKNAQQMQLPPKSQWKEFNPDPSVMQPSQWGRWHTANKSQL